MAQVIEAMLKMQTYGIVNFRTYTGFSQIRLEPISFSDSNDVLIVNVVVKVPATLPACSGRRYMLVAREYGVVTRRVPLALSSPPLKVFQLYLQYGSLDCI